MRNFCLVREWSKGHVIEHTFVCSIWYKLIVLFNGSNRSTQYLLLKYSLNGTHVLKVEDPKGKSPIRGIYLLVILCVYTYIYTFIVIE